MGQVRGQGQVQVQVRDRVHMRVRADVHVLGRLSVRMCVHMYDTVVIPDVWLRRIRMLNTCWLGRGEI